LTGSELIIDLSLEQNKTAVGDAIEFFIDDRITELAKKKKYPDHLREEVREFLKSNSHGTFLWVALVCKQLEKYYLIDRAYEVLKSDFPPELNGVYGRMMESVTRSEDPDLCKQVLAIACAVYRPINWREMKSLLQKTTRNGLSSVIGQCGSFLSIQEDDVKRDDEKFITFVHLSAKAFLLENQDAFKQILPHGLAHQHDYISNKSLENLSTALRHNMYDLNRLLPGYPVKKVSRPDPDPLASLRYSCVYWPDHVLKVDDPRAPTKSPRKITDNSTLSCPNAKKTYELIKEKGVVYNFIEKNYLYWLEALSLLSELREGVRAIARLELFLV
jgi:hypothetical protein